MKNKDNNFDNAVKDNKIESDYVLRKATDDKVLVEMRKFDMKYSNMMKELAGS